jgi:hypothetical protein
MILPRFGAATYSHTQRCCEYTDNYIAGCAYWDFSPKLLAPSASRHQRFRPVCDFPTPAITALPSKGPLTAWPPEDGVTRSEGVAWRHRAEAHRTRVTAEPAPPLYQLTNTHRDSESVSQPRRERSSESSVMDRKFEYSCIFNGFCIYFGLSPYRTNGAKGHHSTNAEDVSWDGWKERSR